MGAVEYQVGAVRIRHRLRIDDRILAIGKLDTMQVTDRRALLLDVVVETAPVNAPVSLFDRRSDPVWIGHRLFDRDRTRGRSEKCKQGYQAGDERTMHARAPEGRGKTPSITIAVSRTICQKSE